MIRVTRSIVRDVGGCNACIGGVTPDSVVHEIRFGAGAINVRLCTGCLLQLIRAALPNLPAGISPRPNNGSNHD